MRITIIKVMVHQKRKHLSGDVKYIILNVYNTLKNEKTVQQGLITHTAELTSIPSYKKE